MSKQKEFSKYENLQTTLMWMACRCEEKVVKTEVIMKKGGAVLLYRHHGSGIGEWFDADDSDKFFPLNEYDAACQCHRKMLEDIHEYIVKAKEVNDDIFAYDLADDAADYLPKFVAEAYKSTEFKFKKRIRRAFKEGIIVLHNTMVKEKTTSPSRQTVIPVNEISFIQFDPCVVITKCGATIPVQSKDDIFLLDYLYGVDVFD